MAETVLFNIPSPQQGQEPVYRINWYQSTDGQTWDIAPIDTTLVSGGSLVLIDAQLNRYSWNSNLADNTKYHLLKTEDQNGVESPTGIVFPPDPLATSDLNVTRTTEGTSVFKIGQVMDLMLEVDQNAMGIIGQNITVRIEDFWGNVIGQVTAEQIGDGIPFYNSQFTIPSNIDALYNINSADETGHDTTLYYLKDTWIFPNNTQVSYSFFVEKIAAEQAVQPDSVYTVIVRNINSTNSEQKLEFTSFLSKYYATIEDLYSIAPYLKKESIFDLVRQISLRSNYVDLHMKPDVIYDQVRYDSAVRCYVAKQAALDKAKVDAGLTSELKQLDTMQVQKTFDIKARLAILEGESDLCANIIYAGGLDTPFTTKLFIKGINDPNRPTTGRARFDEGVYSPYLNYSEKSFVIIDTSGNAIEYRGTRTVKAIEGYR